MAAERVRAVLLLNKALNAAEKGSYEDACQLLDRGIELLKRCRQERQTYLDLAKAYQAGGQMRLEHGDLETGLEWYVRAEDLYSSYISETEDYGRCLHDMAMVFHDLNLNDVALKYAERALAVLERFGEPYVTDLPRMIRQLARDRTETRKWDDKEYLELLQAWRTAKPGPFQAKAGHDFASYLIQSEQGAAHLAEIHASLHDALRWTLVNNDVENALAVLSAFVDMYWMRITLPSWAIQATYEVLNLAQRRGSLGDRAEARTVYALALHAEGRMSEAIGEVLNAAAMHDTHLFTTESSALRMLSSVSRDAAREIAVDLAVKVNDAALVIELLESTRLQVLPIVTRDTKPHTRTGEYKSIAGNLLGVASSALTPPRPISAGGASRLAHRYPPNWVGPPIPIEETIEAIGGVDACWWGAWAFNGRIYWAYMERGVPTCGVIDLAATDLGELLMTAIRHSLLDSGATPSTVLTGPWCRTSRAEADLSAALGDHVIPPPLRARLERATTDDPMSLVIAGNLFGLLPMPLLAAGPATGRADRKRLVELAVIRIAPPAVLVEWTRQNPQYPIDLRPIVVACVDPQNNLANAGRVPHGAMTVLSGTGSSGQTATREALIAALQSSPRSAPGVFYFSGHGSHEGLGGDLEDGLALHDGVLTARDVFTVDQDGRPMIPFPDRVLLSACELAGSRGAGAGEWLGLTAAMLWAGARQVISTHWSIWDTPFTAGFDLELAQNLRRAADPAVTLRKLQMEHLDMWRLSSHDLSYRHLDGIPSRFEKTAFPMIWAAYCCVGISE